MTGVFRKLNNACVSNFVCYRLYQLLEGDNKKQQLFKTYESLERMAQKLKQDCATAQDQLAASSQEQSLLLSKLESDVDTLYDALYDGGNQIQLSSQVSPYLVIKYHINACHILWLRKVWYEDSRHKLAPICQQQIY